MECLVELPHFSPGRVALKLVWRRAPLLNVREAVRPGLVLDGLPPRFRPSVKDGNWSWEPAAEAGTRSGRCTTTVIWWLGPRWRSTTGRACTTP